MSEPNHPLAGKRIALVGGAGFIGHTIALRLAEIGAEPHIIDGLQVNNLGAFSSQQHPNYRLYTSFTNERLDLLREAQVPIHVADARDYSVLTRHLNDIEPDAVVQLAAVAHANRSNKAPHDTFDHSLRTLENALDAVRDRKPHFVFFSSSMVYGNFDGVAATEDRVCDPLGIYGALKFSGEKLVIAYSQVFDLPYTIVRPSALYGERCVSRRVGQAFIENAMVGKNLTVNGDGEDRLDFTYVGDLVQGIERILSTEKSYNEVFNITYGSARSLNDMAEIIKKRFQGIQIEHHPRDSLMPERGTLSIDKARSLLGYEPKNPLELGFESYVDWYIGLQQRRPDLFAV